MNGFEMEFGMRVEQAIGKGVSPEEMMEIMLVDYVVKKANGKGLTTITDGDLTVQCVVNNPAKEVPKRKVGPL